MDWGCGPGRVVQHLISILPEDCQIFGCDYNHEYVSWCSENIKGVCFAENDLSPPLPYESNFFNAIYGISIFTHLSLEMHYKWIEELHRVLKIGGILLITTQGNAAKYKMTTQELKHFEEGKLTVRDKTKEGHRSFLTFHPKSFMSNLISDFELLEFIEGKRMRTGIQQDVWILCKKTNSLTN